MNIMSGYHRPCRLVVCSPRLLMIVQAGHQTSSEYGFWLPTKTIATTHFYYCRTDRRGLFIAGSGCLHSPQPSTIRRCRLDYEATTIPWARHHASPNNLPCCLTPKPSPATSQACACPRSWRDCPAIIILAIPGISATGFEEERGTRGGGVAAWGPAQVTPARATWAQAHSEVVKIDIYVAPKTLRLWNKEHGYLNVLTKA